MKNGVDFNFQKSVDKLVVSDKVCNGLRLENGSMVRARDAKPNSDTSQNSDTLFVP